MMMRNSKAKGQLVEVEGGGRILRSLPRKDRHSKVFTSKGPRDRRVRLSADIAIQFYDVQDRLGYDRPSKAIDWLMKKAKTAIDALNTDRYHHDVLNTILDTSEAFHQTPGERYQQVWTHNQTSSFNQYSLEHTNSGSKREDNPIEELSPMDFSWDPSYDPGEDFAFVDREPLQSSSTAIKDAFSNELLGFNFKHQDEVEGSCNLVSSHYRSHGTPIIHYQE